MNINVFAYWFYVVAVALAGVHFATLRVPVAETV